MTNDASGRWPALLPVGNADATVAAPRVSHAAVLEVVVACAACGRPSGGRRRRLAPRRRCGSKSIRARPRGAGPLFSREGTWQWPEDDQSRLVSHSCTHPRY